MKTILLILTLLIGNVVLAQSSFGTLAGTVCEKTYEDPIVQAKVILQSDSTKTITFTDLDGRFIYSDLPIGKYDLLFVYCGDTAYYESKIEIIPDVVVFIKQEINLLKELTVCCCVFVPYISFEDPELEREDLKVNVNKFQLQEMISGMSSEFVLNNTSELEFQGSRNNDCLQLIDGVKTLKFSKSPASTLKHVTVYNGFIPAKYGDTNGGVVIIETLSYFDLLREWENK